VSKKCISIILAGGRGERLGALTQHASKPSLIYGGNHRMIDFTLNNCALSEIDTVGVLTQYYSAELHNYINTFTTKNLKNAYKIYMLPPRKNKGSYIGTANAVYQNFDFIETFQPENVLILAGDHIYNMDYRQMLWFHCESKADVTIASKAVPLRDASRFGILASGDDGRIYDFQEKPKQPKSNLASMGIYIFTWNALKKHLMEDQECLHSQHDFGRNIIPAMLSSGSKLYTYAFSDYWRDVGTVESLWESNMDLLGDPPAFSSLVNHSLHYDKIRNSIICNGCKIYGQIWNSVLSESVIVGRGSEITNSVIMPNVYIGDDVKIRNAIIGSESIFMDRTEIGAGRGISLFVDPKVCSSQISLVAPWAHIGEGLKYQSGSHINEPMEITLMASAPAPLEKQVYQGNIQ